METSNHIKQKTADKMTEVLGAGIEQSKTEVYGTTKDTKHQGRDQKTAPHTSGEKRHHSY